MPTILNASATASGIGGTGTTVGTLTITGPSASSLTISGDNGDLQRNFRILYVANGGNLSISGVTVSGAKVIANGGGLRNDGTLIVSNSIISGNESFGGGGIYNYKSTLSVTNSTISSNISNSTNLGGGGISNNTGTLTVTNSTISGNTANSVGGGIFNANNGGSTTGATLTVTNSTISGNSATNSGGGIFINSNATLGGSTLTVTNSTLSGNTATNGGGIFNSGTLNTNGSVNIANTIIANSASGGDYAGNGNIGTNSNNLVEDGTLPAGSGNISGDPLLSTLANNGGPTFTMALGAGSPAIGTGNAAISNVSPINAFDQRGYARSTSAPSIGAYEFNGIAPAVAPTVASISPTSGSTAGGTAITITGTGFTGATAVTINGVAATNVVVVSATSITATTPAGTAGANKSVLVTTPGGTNTGNTLFTYTAAPTPPAPSPTPTPTPTPPAPTPTPTPTAPLITGTPPPPSSGGSSTVTLYDPVTGAETGNAVPFPGFKGPVKVVSGDFDGDGVAELIAGAGFGGGPAIAILNSQTGEVMETFFAFDPAFTGGVFVAVQDTNGDGILDIIASAGPGGGPEVRIFNGANLNVLRSFFAYAEDFTGGVSVASIDFNNDGILDLVTGAGPGGAPHVKVYDGATNAILSQWYAYPASFTGGIFVAVGDIGNDGTFEVVTGAGPTGAPVVAVWDPFTGALLAQFMAYAESFTGGVRVAVNDGNGDGIADIVTGAGPGGGPQVNVFSFPALDLLFSFYSGDPANNGGVFVS